MIEQSEQHIAVLGSTGSIGTQTLEVARAHSDRLNIAGLAAGSSRLDLLAEQIQEFNPRLVSVPTRDDVYSLRKKIGSNGTSIDYGEEGNVRVATLPEVDRVVIATPGREAIIPTLEAIRMNGSSGRKRVIALATKEVLVSAGRVVMAEARRNNTLIVPVDSEHSAIFRCLKGHSQDDVERLILTCSGGPFFGYSLSNLEGVTPSEAVKHPRWKMGPKISVDCATLMNKGLEVIEAHWLFGVPPDQIQILIHRQSMVHSLVKFKDGSYKAEISYPDMRRPIQHALSYPEILPYPFGEEPSLAGVTLTFGESHEPDLKTFKCLDYALEALYRGGTAPAALTAANDIAVQAFLDGKVRFTRIADIVGQVLDEHNWMDSPSLEEIFLVDSWAREYASALVKRPPRFLEVTRPSLYNLVGTS